MMSFEKLLWKAITALLLVMAVVFTETSAQAPIVISEADKAEILQAHNNLRSEVSPFASNMLRMEYNESLASFAQVHATRCMFDHSPRSERAQQTAFVTVGENLYASVDSFQMSEPDYNFIIGTQWGQRERQHYNYQSNSCAMGQTCGHYTQTIWATTGYVGCAAVRCDSLAALGNRAAIFFVCEYGPGGNIRGRSPYVSGASCSSCPSDKQVCINKLCSAATALNPTTPSPRPTTEATTQPSTPNTQPTTEAATTPSTRPTTEATTQPTMSSGRPTTNAVTTPRTIPNSETTTVQQITTISEVATTPEIITTQTPGALRFVVYLVGDTPLIEDDGETANLTVVIEASQPVEAITCAVKGITEMDCTDGVAVFSGLVMDATAIRLVRIRARSMQGEDYTIRRKIVISPPSVCAVHFINGGMKVLGSGRAKVEFANRGPTDSFYCQMDQGDFVSCSSGEEFSGLSLGNHVIKVIPDPAQCGRPRRTARLYFTLE